MAITLPTAKHVQAQHAGVTKSGVNPSKSNPESGVHSIPVYSDMGEIGSMLFGHTIADSVNRTETGTTAVQTGLGGFIPRAKAAAGRKTGTFSTAADPGAQNRQTTAAAVRNENNLAAAARRQGNNLRAAGRRIVNNVIRAQRGLPTVSNGSQPVTATPWNGQPNTYTGQQPN